VRLFADDTSIFLIVDNAIESADILNRDLNTITSSSNKWLVSFNPQKTETMVISQKVNKPHHPSLIMNNQQLEDVKYHKHLGVTISDDGSWNKHIELVIDKSYSRLNILRMLKFRLDRLSLEKLYLSFIRPLLEYGDVVWDPHNMYLINILEKVQIEAMRIISGGTKLTPLRPLYKETRLSKLKDRRENHKLIQLFKMENDLTPASLSTLIPINRFQDVHTYNTRHNNAFPLPRTRTSLYASYFLPSTLKLWNSLPPDIKDCPSLSILKSRLTSRVDHDNVPKYYYDGPRLTQILHARLRMRSSSLNQHLYIKNIIDSPNCFCGHCVELSTL
jgi:hypothetical protein